MELKYRGVHPRQSESYRPSEIQVEGRYTFQLRLRSIRYFFYHLTPIPNVFLLHDLWHLSTPMIYSPVVFPSNKSLLLPRYPIVPLRPDPSSSSSPN